MLLIVRRWSFLRRRCGKKSKGNAGIVHGALPGICPGAMKCGTVIRREEWVWEKGDV
jgi:hypothetical protein